LVIIDIQQQAYDRKKNLYSSQRFNFTRFLFAMLGGSTRRNYTNTSFPTISMLANFLPCAPAASATPH
jgi:hypothetical protein